MDPHACGNPIRRNLVSCFVVDLDSEMLQRVEAAFQETDGML